MAWIRNNFYVPINVSDPSFPVEVYEKLNYDHQFNDTLASTLARLRKPDVELVDVANQPEEMLRRRSLPRWRHHSAGAAAGNQTLLPETGGSAAAAAISVQVGRLTRGC